VGGTRRHDKVVIAVRHPIDKDRTGSDVDGGSFAHKHSDVSLAAQYVTQRRRNGRCRESCGPDLVQQWLKGVVIAFIKQQDLDRRMA
jgi:hypothetical protein